MRNGVYKLIYWSAYYKENEYEFYTKKHINNISYQHGVAISIQIK